MTENRVVQCTNHWINNLLYPEVNFIFYSADITVLDKALYFLYSCIHTDKVGGQKYNLFSKRPTTGGTKCVDILDSYIPVGRKIAS